MTCRCWSSLTRREPSQENPGKHQPLEEDPDGEEPQGQRQGDIQVSDFGILHPGRRVRQIRPRHVVWKPKPLVPEPGGESSHVGGGSSPPGAHRELVSSSTEKLRNFCPCDTCDDWPAPSPPPPPPPLPQLHQQLRFRLTFQNKTPNGLEEGNHSAPEWNQQIITGLFGLDADDIVFVTYSQSRDRTTDPA